MPASLTEVANLALDLIGEPYLADYATDTGTAAEAVRLHLPHCLAALLEGHAWSFAAATAELSALPMTTAAATLATGTAAANNALLWTANTLGPSGNSLSVAIGSPSYPFALATDGFAITVTPAYVAVTIAGTLTSDGTTPIALQASYPLYTVNPPRPSFAYIPNEIPVDEISWNPTLSKWYLSFSDGPSEWTSTADVATPDLIPTGAWHTSTNPHAWKPTSPATGTPAMTLLCTPAADLITASAAEEVISLLVTVSNYNGSDGTGSLATASGSLAGGVIGIYAPAWGSAYNLPEDCLRLLTIDGADIDAPQTRFEIQGRALLMPYADAAPVIRYITASPPVTSWPTTFTDALTQLLAARLAPKLTQDGNLAAALAGSHELALGKARGKDARETRSAENHGPRQLLARSGFVQARFGGLPPAASGGPLPEAPASAPDLDIIFNNNL